MEDVIDFNVFFFLILFFEGIIRKFIHVDYESRLIYKNSFWYFWLRYRNIEFGIETFPRIYCPKNFYVTRKYKCNRENIYKIMEKYIYEI